MEQLEREMESGEHTVTWAGPHLDVLYHDCVGEAVRLQILLDVTQLGEGDPHVHRETGSGRATPEVHLLTERRRKPGCLLPGLTHSVGTLDRTRSLFYLTGVRFH